MHTQHNIGHIETVIIGAGQAGLATGYHLKRRGREFVILDAAARVGDQWRQQWNTLRLYSPAQYDGLPGLPFPAKRWSFPGKEEVADYLESYAAKFGLPVRFGTRVEGLEPAPDGRYIVKTSTGALTCDNVVVATGTFGRTPSVPDFARELDPSILQLHSTEYRRPAQLRDGAVLVVGGSHSGTDIAYEVAQTHPTILAGRDPGQIPFRIEGRAMHFVFPVASFFGEPRLAEPVALVGLEVQRVGSAWGAVSRLPSVRFPTPPAEPAVRLSPQRALHEGDAVRLRPS